MKLSASCRIVLAGLFAAAGFSVQPTTQAAIVGPYTVDADTLHLWHLDESGVPAIDAVANPPGTNCVTLNFTSSTAGATLGNASYPGFSTALFTGQDDSASAVRNQYLSPVAGNPNTTTASFTFANATTRAFTYEALVYIGFDPLKNLGTAANGGNGRNAPCSIMSIEGGAGARIFQFRIMQPGTSPGGTGNPAVMSVPYLTFENISGGQNTIYATIPTTGPDAILSNNWYHVAVSYNGVPNTANNIKFYWTLLDPSRTKANQLSITSTLKTCSGFTASSSSACSFELGNQARNNNANFLGLIDEVRMSGVERTASQMLFYPGIPVVVTPPASQTLAAADPVSLTVSATGALPLAYQWRLDGTNLPGASLSAFSIAAVQATDVGTYDVVVTNTYGAVTSTPATLSLRVPLNLTWVGSAGALWDTSSVNWATNGDTFGETAYAARDNVTFDSTGSATPVVTLTSSVSPYSLTVNADSDYTLTTTNGATLGGFSQLLKRGNGTLVLDVDCPILGPATIQSGTVQIGNATNRGSLGYGPVTNNGSLVIYRTGALSLTNWLVGTGSLINNATNNITLSGSNLLSGPVTFNAGTLILTTPQAKGNSSQYTFNATANATGSTTLSLWNGLTFGPDTTLSFLGTLASPDYRCGVISGSATNTFNCGIVLDGSGSVCFISSGAASNSLLQVTAPSINCPGFAGQLTLRGTGNGVLTSQVTLGGKLSKTDTGTWTITSTGNSWVSTDVGNGILRMGANNVLPDALTLNIGAGSAGTVDLAGFNQTVDTLTGAGTIANSSTVADSTFTVHPSGNSIFLGVIRDSVSGGTRKVGLTVSSGTLSLQGTNTYTGPTTILAGSLQLLFNGSISNSATIAVSAGAAVDAATRNDGTFTLTPGQTLKGDGAFNVTGNLASAGTIELKLSKSGTTLANDQLTVSGGLACGGTLKVDLTASPGLTTGDAFQLFNAWGGYSGAFAQVIPGPGPGLMWDTSTLTTDGTLRVAINPIPTTGTNITCTLTGDQLELSWPTSYIGWRLQAQTNNPGSGLSTNWVDVPNSSSTNRVFFPIDKTTGSVFYRMSYSNP